MQTHRWSGWPGAWCLDCGTEDPREVFLCDGDVFWFEDDDSPEGIKMITNPACELPLALMMICPEPESGRFDPYRAN